MSVSPINIFVPKHGGKLGEGFARHEIIDSYAYPGRRTKSHAYTSPASEVTGLADARKAIQLCEVCRLHFNPRKEHYRIRFVPSIDTSGYTASGRCDACLQHGATNAIFVPEEIWEAVSCDPQETRIRARMAWKRREKLPSVFDVLSRIRRRIAEEIQRRKNHG